MSLSKKFEKDFRRAIKDNQDPCWRCTKAHGTKKCKTDFAECYWKGRAYLGLLPEPNGKEKENLGELRKLAETIWQEGVKTTVAVKATQSKGPGSNKARKQRTPIPDSGLGDIMYIQNSTPAGLRSNVPQEGPCQVETEYIGASPGKDDPVVVSNYVQVNAVPTNLFVYSLSFWRPNSDLVKPPLVYNKRREIKHAFEYVLAADNF